MIGLPKNLLIQSRRCSDLSTSALKAKMRKAQKVQTKLDLAADDEVRAQSSETTTPRCLKFAMDRDP